MGGQTKRLLRKLGRTIESATTQPLWITFRHADTFVSGSCLSQSLIMTLPSTDWDSRICTMVPVNFMACP